MAQAPRPPAGSMVAGFEFPPRIWPPDPQHLDLVQTYDPRASTQLGETGEGIERETVVTFNTQFASYYAGESAAFTEAEAARLAEIGVVGEGGGAATAPVNTAVPAVTQAAGVLSCTVGEWTGEPTGYAYQWQVDGTNVGTDSADYTAQPADAGLTATCVVTATNAAGSTAAPPSVGVVIA